MSTVQARIWATVGGVFLAYTVVMLVLVTTPVSVYTGPAPTIDHVLWMHPETPGASGDEHWYNLTLTVNQTVPLADLIFQLHNPGNEVYYPPTGGLSVLRGATLVALWNFSGPGWNSGKANDLVNGDWFELQVGPYAIDGYTLVALATDVRISTTSVVLP